MHYLEIKLERYATWHANFNGDFSGNIILSEDGGLNHHIPYHVIEAIVAEKVRRDRIAKLEDARPKDLGL